MTKKDPATPFHPKTVTPPPKEEVPSVPTTTHRVVFDTARGGFDMRQVDHYLDQVAGMISPTDPATSLGGHGLLIDRTTPEHIRRRRFGTVRRGYDTDQVHAYLEDLAKLVEDLLQDSEAAEERRQATVLALRSGPKVSRLTPALDPGWSWKIFILASLGVVVFILLVGVSGSLFVEPVDLWRKVVCISLLVIGASLLIGGIRKRSMGESLLGMALMMTAVLGLMGIATCHQDCWVGD